MKKFLYPVLLVFVLILMCLPRFDRQDMGLISSFTNKSGWGGVKETADESTFPPDVRHYIAYVHYFRAEPAGIRLAPPFSYRPLVPFLASLLPLRPLTGIDLLSIAFLSAGLLFLYRTLLCLGHHETRAFIGGLLFAVSFPVFYYSTTGYVDAALIGLLCAAVYFFIRKKFAGFILTLLAATLVKETAIVIFPAAFLYAWRVKERRTLIVVGLSFLLYLLTAFLIRKFAPGDAHYGWFASRQTFMDNVSRPRTFLSFFMTLGPVGLLAMWRIAKGNLAALPYAEFLLTGFVTAIALFGYAMLSAYADGRFIWTAYPFLIPVAADALRMFGKKGAGDDRPGFVPELQNEKLRI